MASVQELKDALSSEQAKAAELAEKSFQAIDTITNQANFWLTFISVEIAIIGLIGLVAIYIGSRNTAKKIANERINTYLSTDEGRKFVRQSIEEEIRQQIQSRSFVVAIPDNSQEPDGAFKKDPKIKGDE